MDKYLLLIDGSSLLTTQFFGNLPTEILFAKTEEEKAGYFHKIMQTSKGVYTNAIFGFLRTLMKICKEQKPAYIAVAWDMSRDTFRREMYADYKGNRGETIAPLGEQFGLCQSILERLGIRQFMDNYYEADDFCGTLSRRFENEVPVRILTKDNDYLQLVSDRTNLWMMHATAKKTDELYAKYRLPKDGSAPDRSFPFTPERVVAEFGIEPASVADLKGLQGDSSDNIKGVPGIGPATATALIAKYKTIEALYEAMEGLDEKQLKDLAASWKDIGISRSPVKNLLRTDDNELVGREAAFLSKKLATIKRDIDLGDLKLSDLAVNINQAEAVTIFSELEFRSLKPDFGTGETAASSFTYKTTSDLSEVEELIGELTAETADGQRHNGKHLGFATVGLSDGLCAVALCIPGEPVGNKDSAPASETVVITRDGFVSKSYLADMLARLDDAGIVLAGFDIKRQIKKMDCVSFLDAFDESVAQYMLDPLSGAYDYASVYHAVTGDICDSSADILGKTDINEAWETMRGKVVEMAAREAAAAFTCYGPLAGKLEETGMSRLFYDVEMPLVYTLAGMEQEGVLVRKDLLKEFGRSLSVDIDRLEKEIYESAGEEFNINSPKQLGVILFEKLKLPLYPFGKKTKTGYSTSADVLEKLKLEDPIVEKILEYRQLTKLKSTYAEGLFEYIDEDDRIRTTFNQLVTATGRLSSTEPNLQNIPIRTELGRELRKVFVPREGCVFVDADYSQIELRILAALSGDDKLIDAYRTAKDIHTATASAVFHVPYDIVSPELRRRAKAVNFGIVYGISSYGLSNDLDIPMKEAEQYINDYFETYPGIRAYLDGLVESAKANGYAVTAFGRRRPIPELTSTNYMQRQLGERMAMNSPIQGTAADIIKIAMVRVDTRLRSEIPEAKLVLQVHDELLVETPAILADRVRDILTDEMKHAADLAVSLEVGIEQGSDWYEAH